MTVSEYLDAWLAGAHSLSPKTLERYQELADRQIRPHLGPIKLQKLSPEHIPQWHGKLLSEGLAPLTASCASSCNARSKTER
jgi:hypothetical protein